MAENRVRVIISSSGRTQMGVFLIVFVCVCARAHTHTHVHVHTGGLCVEVRGQPLVSSLRLHLPFLETGYTTGLELTVQ